MTYYISIKHLKSLGRQNARSFAALLLKSKADESAKIVLEEKNIEFYDLKTFQSAISILRREFGSEWVDQMLENE